MAKGDPVMLEAFFPDGRTAQIGTWSLPSELNDNYHQQKDIGWHAMLSLLHGATRVEIRVGQPQPTSVSAIVKREP